MPVSTSSVIWRRLPSSLGLLQRVAGAVVVLLAMTLLQPAQAHRHGAHAPSKHALSKIVRPTLSQPQMTHGRVTHAEASPPMPGASTVVPVAVVQAIQAAQRDVQADPLVLLAIAWQESRFDPLARNHHSSARGLLQFTTATWLTVVRDFGPKHGLARYASAISTRRNGNLVVTTPAMQKAILALRDDPQLQAVMAAERLARERVVLEAGLGRRVTAADLYVLHLLGPAGALDFLTELAREPTTPSAEVVGPAVRANAGLFIRDGRALSLSEAYDGIAATLRRQADQYGALIAAEG